MKLKRYLQSEKFMRDNIIGLMVDEVFDGAVWRLKLLREATILLLRKATMCEHHVPADHSCEFCGRKV